MSELSGGTNLPGAFDIRGGWQQINHGGGSGPSNIRFEFEFSWSEIEKRNAISMAIFPEPRARLIDTDDIGNVVYKVVIQGEAITPTFADEIISVQIGSEFIDIASRSRILTMHPKIDGGYEEWDSYGLNTYRSLISRDPTNGGPFFSHVYSSVRHYFQSITLLNAERVSPESMPPTGQLKLASQADNLPALIATLGGSRRMLDPIIADFSEIFGRSLEVHSVFEPGNNAAILTIDEDIGRPLSMLWRNASSGQKQAIYSVVTARLAQPGSLVAIEEPESNLHLDATAKLLGVLDNIAREEDKQLIVTTHSPLVVDLSPVHSWRVFEKDSTGATKVSPGVSLHDGKGVLQSFYTMSQLQAVRTARKILIVEGRDDLMVWEVFSRKYQMETGFAIIQGGNDEGAIRQAKLFVLFRALGMMESLQLLILDSDGRREERIARLHNEGFGNHEFHVMREKELESYLLDSEAIAAVTNRRSDVVESAISQSNGTGKQKIKNVFRHLDSPLSSEVKRLIAEHMNSLPLEIDDVLQKFSGL